MLAHFAFCIKLRRRPRRVSARRFIGPDPPTKMPMIELFFHEYFISINLIVSGHIAMFSPRPSPESSGLLARHFCALHRGQARRKELNQIVAFLHHFGFSAAPSTAHSRIYISSGHKGTDAIFICEPHQRLPLGLANKHVRRWRQRAIRSSLEFSLSRLSRGGQTRN
jgi:hypothetical protein